MLLRRWIRVYVHLLTFQLVVVAYHAVMDVSVVSFHIPSLLMVLLARALDSLYSYPLQNYMSIVIPCTNWLHAIHDTVFFSFFFLLLLLVEFNSIIVCLFGGCFGFNKSHQMNQTLEIITFQLDALVIWRKYAYTMYHTYTYACSQKSTIILNENNEQFKVSVLKSHQHVIIIEFWPVRIVNCRYQSTN